MVVLPGWAGPGGGGPPAHRPGGRRAAGQPPRLARALSGGAMERGAVIVAGFGFRSGVSLCSLRAAFALAGQGQPPVTHLAAAHDKLAALVPLAEVLDRKSTRLNSSH